MLRALAYAVTLGALVAASVWLANRPGSVTLYWQGYRIDTSFGVLVSAVVVVILLAGLFYRLWFFLTRAPGALIGSRREKRRRKGLAALRKGLVAMAAGEAGEARKQVRRAGDLLHEKEIALLVSAQAAQAAGDRDEAERYFTAMLENPETEFLGVRGLLAQALAEGRQGEALRLSERAYRLKPGNPWVAAKRFDLQVRTRQWGAAAETLSQMVRDKLVAPEEARFRLAVLDYQLSLEAGTRGDEGEALKRVRKAHQGAPGFVPAAARLARMFAARGIERRALGVIETTWELQPHPDLLEAYLEISGPENAEARMKAIRRLTRTCPQHPESRLALARAALDAHDWEEARKELAALTAERGSARACRLMAELEEAENGDMGSAREWLMRASLADPDPVWTCEACGSTAAEWGPLCPSCSAFATLTWRAPPPLPRLTHGPGAGAPRLESPVEEKEAAD